MPKKQPKTMMRSLLIATDQVVVTTQQGFSEEIDESLINQVNDLANSRDGERARVRRIHYSLRIYATGPFVVQPVIVQTVGQFADTVNLTGDTVEELLDSSIDDDFGSQKLGPATLARYSWMIPSDDGPFWIANIEIDLPQNILEVINRGTQDEILQNLGFGIVGKFNATSASLNYIVSRSIDFELIAKTISIR